MIDARELRIGNLITYHGDIIEVTGIVRNTIHYKGGFDANTGEYRPYQPIPLTEQWLIDFGFGKVQNIYQRHNQILLDPESNGSYKVKFWTHSISRAEPLYKSNLAIRSVHQLQNLYFALTGEELQL